MSVAKRLNYLQRLFGTAMGFLSFGLGGLFFAVTVVPWVWLTNRSAHERAVALRRWISRGFRTHVNMLRSFGVLTYHWHNAERLNGAGIVIANHPTLLDVVFLVGFIENAVCVVKAALFENFFIGFVIRTAGYVSNDDPERMISLSAAALQTGATVVIFPEGTRSVPGQAPHLQRGAAYIALAGGKALTPVRISCVPSSLTKAERWYEIPDRAMRYDFAVGTDLQVNRQTDTPRALAGRSVNEKIKQLLFNTAEPESKHVSVDP